METPFPGQPVARPTMLRARSRTIAPQDPISLLAASRPPRALWSDGQTLVFQEGVAASVDTEGPARTRRMRDALPAVAHGGPGPGPLWLGGLAFQDDHEATGAWAGFPAARFTLGIRQVALHEGQWTETRIEADPAPAPVPGPQADGMAGMDRGSWDAGVAAATEAIRDGHLAKVVLARAVPRPPGDAVETLRSLHAREPESTLFFFEPIEGHAFLGTTPELLVRLAGGTVSTHALAGSVARGASEAEDEALARGLLGSQKDVLEHELVAAFLRERLAESGVDGVRQGRRGVRRLGAVQHLETPIVGHAGGGHVLDLVAALHPTPAVCGTPRRRSLELIRRLEPFPRGWYAGAVGWFAPDGDGELSVALRCALCLPDARHLFAGAGIVAGSEAADEWDETDAKMRSLEAAL